MPHSSGYDSLAEHCRPESSPPQSLQIVASVAEFGSKCIHPGTGHSPMVPTADKAREMSMKLTAMAVLTAMTVLSVAGGGSAWGAAAAPGTTDSTFMHDNAQTNLAEIAIGKI